MFDFILIFNRFMVSQMLLSTCASAADDAAAVAVVLRWTSTKTTHTTLTKR